MSSFDGSGCDFDSTKDLECLFDMCEDPDCLSCQGDSDGDVAFWDEFMADPEDFFNQVTDLSLRIVDEVSGKEEVISGPNILPYQIFKD